MHEERRRGPFITMKSWCSHIRPGICALNRADGSVNYFARIDASRLGGPHNCSEPPQFSKNKIGQNMFSNIVMIIADINLSSTELESGNATGAFLQTPAPVLDNISGPMGAILLSNTGLQFGTLIGRAQFHPVPVLDKNSVSQIMLQFSPKMFGHLFCVSTRSRQISFPELSARSQENVNDLPLQGGQGQPMQSGHLHYLCRCQQKIRGWERAHIRAAMVVILGTS